MDIKELDQLAKNNEPMPHSLAAYEQAYYQASRYLYRQFFDDKLDLMQCRNEKKKIIEQYNLGKRSWEYFMSLTVIQDKLKKLQEQGFDSVLEWEILELINNKFKE